VQFFGLYLSENGEQYMVTEYMSKGSLLDLLRSQERANMTVADLLAM
jgi:serine/threonine protein kinase